MPPRRIVQQQFPDATDLLALPPALGELAVRQVGVLTRAQLDAHGYPPCRIRAQIRARRWRAYGRFVLVLGNAPLTPAQREWAAVLMVTKPVGLAGLSAAAAGGLTGFEPERVHIVVRHATHVAMPHWVKIHESRRFSADDLNHVAAPPRTRTARSIIDAATWSRRPRRACAILCASVQQRLVTPEQLAEELQLAGRIRHVAIMREILGDISGGGHTLAEIDFGRLVERAGFPRPTGQRFRRDHDGKVRWLDVEIDLPDGSSVIVEIDGKGHLATERWWDDVDRQNEVVIDGKPVLRYPSAVVRLFPDRIISQLHRMRLAHLAAG
jgi:hypothetical protein